MTRSSVPVFPFRFCLAAMANEGAQFGNTRRFSGESLDPKEYRRWKLWAEAKMASTKDMTAGQRGPFVLCLLDGVAFETCEHLSLDKLKEENGDKYVWAALDETVSGQAQARLACRVFEGDLPTSSPRSRNNGCMDQQGPRSLLQVPPEGGNRVSK